MKYRKGFVTNSSSSSFIMGFKNKESIARTIKRDILYTEEFCSHEDYEFIIKEVKNHMVSKEEAERHYSRSWEWDKEKRGFMEIIDEKSVKLFREVAKDCMVFSIPTFDDHTHSNIEHEIAPYLKCTLKRISNH